MPNRYSVNPKLGNWVSNQRRNYWLQQEGKPSPTTAQRTRALYQEEKSTSMKAEHIRALDGVGFDWGTPNFTWNERFEQLCEFKVQFGHCIVPVRYPVNPSQARILGFEAAHNLQEVSERKAKSHDSGAYLNASECWIRDGINCYFLEQTF